MRRPYNRRRAYNHAGMPAPGQPGFSAGAHNRMAGQAITRPDLSTDPGSAVEPNQNSNQRVHPEVSVQPIQRSNQSVDSGFAEESKSEREIMRERIIGDFKNRPVRWWDRPQTRQFGNKEEAAASIDKQAQKQKVRNRPGWANRKAHNRRMRKDPDYAARVQETIANGGTINDVENDAWNGDWYDYEY